MTQNAQPTPPDPFEEAVNAAEEDVCGCLLRGPEHIDRARILLDPEDFQSERCRIVFTAAGAMRDAGVPVDRRSMVIRLKSEGNTDALGGDELIAKMLERMESSVLDPAALPENARLVKHRRMFQRMVALGGAAAARAEGRSSAAPELAAWLVREAAKIAQAELEKDSIPLSRIAADAVERYDAFGRGQKPRAVATGITRMDLLIGGFMPREMIVVGARPSVGKSALMAQCAISAGWQGIPSVIFSLEMDRASLFDRMMSSVAEITLHRLRGIVPLDEDDARKIIEQTRPGKLATLPMFVIDRKDLTGQTVANAIRHHVASKGVGIAFIDYLQYLQPENDRDSVNVQIGKTCRAIKQVAEECNIPVVCLAQLNRENQNRTDTTPRLSDLKGSGDIEQAADVIILLDRLDEDDSLAYHRVNLIVAKNRNGPRGTIETEYDRKHVRFIDKVPG